MEKSRNGSDTDYTCIVIGIFRRINGHVMGDKTVWESYVVSDEQSTSMESESAVQQHLVSSVVFRRIETENRYLWELENVWDNVSVRRLDDIGQKAIYEWRPPNYSGQINIEAAMAENMNIVLLRMILDWSREDGNVWSQQVVWSGSFSNWRRLLQILENDSNAANCIELRVERYDLHPHFRQRYLALHDRYPVAAAIAAVDCSQTITIPAQSIGMDDGEGEILICAICHDMLVTGQNASQLPCNHLFHRNCICQWFFTKLECPLCRAEFKS